MCLVLVLSVALCRVFMVICQKNPQSDESAYKVSNDDLWLKIKMPKKSYFGGKRMKMYISTACNTISLMTIGIVH